MTAAAGAPQRFPIRVGPRSRPVILLWGARPETAYAEVDDDEFRARFGPFRLRTSLANITSWRIEGPFTWLRAIGVRVTWRRGDTSFAGSAHGGLRVDLREPIRWGPLVVPAIYVAVDDLQGLADALQARGISGVDARRAR
jgi:hypothetical protein